MRGFFLCLVVAVMVFFAGNVAEAHGRRGGVNIQVGGRNGFFGRRPPVVRVQGVPFNHGGVGSRAQFIGFDSFGRPVFVYR